MMKPIPLLVVTNALALGLVVVLFVRQQDLEARLGSARSAASRPAEAAQEAPWLDARLERVERELALRPGAVPEAPEPPPPVSEGPGEAPAAPAAPGEAWGGAGAPADLTPEQMEVFRRRVRRAGELNAEEDRLSFVFESVDRLVAERKIAPLSAGQRDKVARTILTIRDRVPAVFRKFREDAAFRDLPQEQRRTAVRAEIDGLRAEAQKALEEVVPAQDAKTLVDEASTVDGERFRAGPFGPRERPQ